MKKILLVLLVMALIIVIMPFANVSAEPAGKKVLNAVVPWPVNHPLSREAFMFKDMIDKASGGKLTIKIRGGPEVFPAMDQPQAVSTGAIDLVLNTSGGYFTGFMPEAEAITLTRLIPAEERKTGYYDLLDKIFQEKANLKYLGHPNAGESFLLSTNVPVEKPQDLVGLSIRVSPIFEAFIKKLGAAPVNIALSELYTALEQGVVEGYVALGAIAILGFGYQDVTKCVIMHDIFTVDTVNVMNLDTWNSLPKDMQELVMEVSMELEEKGHATHLKVVDMKWKELRDTCPDIKLVKFSPEDAKWYTDTAYNVTWDRIIAKAPKYGPKLRELSSK